MKGLVAEVLNYCGNVT